MHRACGKLLETGDEPQQRRLPGAARAEHGDDLTLGDVERQALERNGRARPVAVDAERVPDGDGRRHSKLHEVRSGASARKAPRTVASTTTTAEHDQQPECDRDGAGAPIEHERRERVGRAARHLDDGGNEPRQEETEDRSADDAECEQTERACPEMGAQRRRGGALHLEIEERVPLVPEVAEHRRPQSDDGEQDRCESGRTEHGGNAPGEGVVVRLLVERLARSALELRERASRERQPAAVVLASRHRQPDLAGRARTGSVRGQRRLQRVLVDDGELLVLAHRREAPGDRDDRPST